MHILFFEPDSLGHQAAYVAYLVRYIGRHRPNLRATFAVDPRLLDLLDAETRALLAANSRARISAIPLPHRDMEASRRPLLILRSMARWSVMRRLLRRTGADHGHFLSIDDVLARLLLRSASPGSIPVSGILYRPSVHYAELGGAPPEACQALWGRIKSLVYAGALANPSLARLFSLDPYFSAQAPRRYRGGERVVALADPMPPAAGPGPDEPPALPAALDGDRVLFLLFGALHPRKGIETVLQAARRLEPRIARSSAILFAGRVDGAIRERFHAECRAVAAAHPDLALHVEDRFLPEPELAGLVRRADVVLAPYHRHTGPSGVLLWAAAAGKPVITQDYGLIARETTEGGLGLAVDTRDPGALAAAITLAVEAGPAAICRPAGQRAFCAGRSAEEFARTIVDGITDSARHRDRA